LRGLIKPAPATSLAYVDWSSQEVAIAAALSGDQRLAEAVKTGDPYLAFAVRAGLAPAGATKASHGELREVCKVAVLGTNYGMGPASLAHRTGLSVLEARELLRRLAQAFPTFWAWAEHMIDLAMLTGRLETVFGWPVHVTDTTRPTSLRNFPMQAHGAEMLRLACCLATEAGITVCAPVHDALLIEAPTVEVEEAIAITREAMTEASQAGLDGLTINTSVVTVHYPERYADPRGAVMWRHTTELLARARAGCGGCAGYERFGSEVERPLIESRPAARDFINGCQGRTQTHTNDLIEVSEFTDHCP
jgi:DNA polymerase I-like protein with 3'-5' exonuclease and polymerase domains